MKNTKTKLSYSKSGVDTSQEEKAMKSLLKWIIKADAFRPNIGRAVLKSGYFANVLDIGSNLGLAISTDGVGTKLLIAQMMNKYDTIGIDCIAMNVNDLICVGAQPLSIVDYLAVQKPDPKIMEEIGKGLYEGAKLAKINIPGGELAQIKEMIKGYKENIGFDIAGTSVGIVPLDKIIIGQNIEEDDVIIGLRSSGIHSNGLTLARNIFFNKMGFKPNKYLSELKKTIGEELLEPTQIYVQPIMEILKANINVKALANITGDGLTNLTRVEKENVSFIIDYLPEPHPVFKLIQKFGSISDEEMFQTFNMGIGFCVTVSKNDVEKSLGILNKYKIKSYVIGHIVKDKKKQVIIKPINLVGIDNNFYKIK